MYVSMYGRTYVRRHWSHFRTCLIVHVKKKSRQTEEGEERNRKKILGLISETWLFFLPRSLLQQLWFRTDLLDGCSQLLEVKVILSNFRHVFVSFSPSLPISFLLFFFSPGMSETVLIGTCIELRIIFPPMHFNLICHNVRRKKKNVALTWG